MSVTPQGTSGCIELGRDNGTGLDADPDGDLDPTTVDLSAEAELDLPGASANVQATLTNPCGGSNFNPDTAQLSFAAQTCVGLFCADAGPGKTERDWRLSGKVAGKLCLRHLW